MKIGVVIPSFRVRKYIVSVTEGVLPYADRVYIVDDCCPEGSGEAVTAAIADPKVKVVRHEVNQGVGGAVITGYSLALQDGCDVVIKMDGDGQMDPRFITELVRPIAEGVADYTKGNRFFSIDYMRGMPRMRLFGNSVLSFVNKVSSGYWNVMDPTNGFTACHAVVLRWIPLAKLSRRYFFECDLLFRLGTIRAVVKDIPMPSLYGDEISNMNIRRVVTSFPQRYLANYFKRFIYNYVLRDVNVGTIETLMGVLFLLFGVIFGGVEWYRAAAAGVSAPTGTIILATLGIILGVQFLLAALSFDIANVPSDPVHRKLPPSGMKSV